MDRSFDKDKPQQEALRHEDRKERKHEGVRENRPERPAPEGEEKLAHEKRDEEQDKKVKRDEEKPKVAGDEDLDKDEDLALDEPQAAEGESKDIAQKDVVETEPVDDEAASQGI